MEAGVAGAENRENRDVALPKSKIFLPRFHRPRPKHNLPGIGDGGWAKAADVEGLTKGGVAQFPIASPTWSMLSPNPPSRPPGQEPSLASWSGFGKRRKRGSHPLPSFSLPPSLIGCASLEPNFSRSRLCLSPKGAGVQRHRAGGAATNPGVGISGAPRGRGADRGWPLQPPRGPALRVSRPRLLSAPRPFLSSEQRPPSSSVPPPPPRPPPPLGFSFLPLARSAAHSAAAASRRESRSQTPRGPLAAAADL